LEGLYTPSALGHCLLRIRPPKMFFARAIISALETSCVRRLVWGRTVPSTRRLDGPGPGEAG
jgi:hypothetical protein